MDPPTRVICKLRATSDIIEYEGAASPPASMSSAYSGKLSFEYGPFHISYKNKTKKLQQVKGNKQHVDVHFLPHGLIIEGGLNYQIKITHELIIAC
jgi:hypothetical protein